MKKNQDPKEALISLISDARAHVANIEAACVILENSLNGVDPKNTEEFLDKMADLSFGRLLVEKLRKALQEEYSKLSTRSVKNMTAVEQVVEASHEEFSPVSIEDASGALFDAVQAGTLTRERFVMLVGDMVSAAFQRGVWSTYDD